MEFIKVFPHFNFLKPLFDKELISKKTWKKGEILFHSTSWLDSLYFFTSGRGRAYLPLNNGKEVVYAPYGAGDIAGDVEFIVNMKATGSMLSIKNLSGFCLNKSIITEEMNLLLYKLIAKGVTSKLIASSIENSVRIGYGLDERVAHYCLYEYEDKIYSMDELAGLFRTTYRHLSRVLKNFSDRGFIKVENRVITVLNRPELEQLSILIKEDLHIKYL